MNLFGKSQPPTVPLALHESIVASMRADLEAERKRYDALLDQFARLKVAGAVVEPVVVNQTIEPIVRGEDDLEELIGEIAGEDVRKRRVMLRQLKKDRAAKRNEDDIRADIENGVSGSGVPA